MESLIKMDDDIEQERAAFSMNLEANRLATFKDWPCDENCNCTPDKMAAAGFFHCPTENEPDLVKCFVCFKELDGWEPDDDPWQEHKSHSGHCPFLSMKTKEDWTISEFLKLESQRQQNRLMKVVQAKIKEFQQHAQEVREQMELLA